AQRISASPQTRQKLLDLDGIRHVPARLKDDRAHEVGKDRRLPVDAAGDDALFKNNFAIFYDANLEFGNVDQNVEIAEVVRHPAPLFHIREQLRFTDIVAVQRPTKR